MDKRTYERKRKRIYRENLYLSDSDVSSNDEEQNVHNDADILEPDEFIQNSSPLPDIGHEEHEGMQAEDHIQEEREEGIRSDDDWGLEGNSSDVSDLDSSSNASSEDSDDDEANYNDNANTPIYEGSRLTLIQSFVALLAMFFRCQLSIQSFKIILATIALHLPEQSNFFSSMHYFNKFLPNNQLFVKKNHYCKTCYIVDGFGECICQDKTSGNFLTFSIVRQLDVLYQRESFRNLLKHRFIRKKKCEANIEDIYDSEVYKTYVNNGFLRNRYNISFLWYTDGVPLYKSSKYSVWPLFFIINELPYAVRYLPENVIFGGLWFGSSKPYFNSFFLPLNEELNALQNTGVTLSARDERGENIFMKAKILCGCCDLPARALVLNMNQFNGLYSCHKCLIRGKKYFYTETSSVFVFSNSEGHEITLRNLR